MFTIDKNYLTDGLGIYVSNFGTLSHHLHGSRLIHKMLEISKICNILTNDKSTVLRLFHLIWSTYYMK